MKLCYWLAFILVMTLQDIVAQNQDIQWTKLFSIPVRRLDLMSVDNKDQVFYADTEGNVMQFDTKGDSINNYSPQRQTKLSKLEAFWTVNLFLFSRDMQAYEILDRFLNPLSSNSLNNENIGLAKAATFGNNNMLWIFDESDLSLKQYDYRRNRILQHQPLPLLTGMDYFEVLDLAERQNLLFILIKDFGIALFDNQGNWIKKIALATDHPIQLRGNFLYFIENGLLHKLNFQTDELKKYPIPDISYNRLTVGSSKFYFYTSNHIHVYQIPKLD